MVDGAYLPSSIALMVCRLTCTLLAKSAWVIPVLALLSLIVFFTARCFSQFVNDQVKPDNE